MNLITTNTEATMMSSRELADMYDKRHDNVLSKIRKLEDAYVQVYGGDLKFKESSYLNGQNKEQPEILLNKSQALFVASRFDAVLHAKVQKRWEELEKQVADQPYHLPTNFKEALLQLVDQVEQNEQLQATVTEQAPKVAALDRISLAEGTHCVTNAAKILQVRPKDLFDFLSFNRWTYKRAGNKSWTAYQDKIQQGLLTHKVTTVTDMYTGKEKIIEQVLVTAKGIATLSKKLQEEVAA